MPERVKDLPSFLRKINYLLKVTSECRAVLFRFEFQQNIVSVIDEFSDELQSRIDSHMILYPEGHKEMRIAGLYGTQLNLKLESFESSLVAFEANGGQDNLEEALGKGEIILASRAGAIPGFGSFAQELVDFLLKELRKQFRWRPW
jgi:hypothetical protein